MNIFLEHLKDELAYQGLTQKELAEKTGISVNTIRGWFSKDFTPDIFSAVKIAKALKVSTEYLVFGKSQKEELSYEDLTLLDTWHKLSTHDKKVLKTIISTMTNISDEISPDSNNYVIIKKD